MKLRLSSPITTDSIVDGPGLRGVIWVQGCNHNCEGCHNPQTHDVCGGFDLDIDEIIDKIKSFKLQRGITLSGGEPFLQQEALSIIAKESKKMRLDVWAYTGFNFESLVDKKNKNYFLNINLLKNIDVLVDGKFQKDKKDISLLYRGSSNQRIIDIRQSLAKKKICLSSLYSNEENLLLSEF